MKEYIDILCNCPLFSGLKEDDIKEIISLRNQRIEHFQKNDIIIKINEDLNYIGVVLRGSVGVQKSFVSGKCFNIFYKRQGEVFGGALALDQKMAYQIEIIAQEICEILIIHKESIKKLFSKNEIIANNLLALFVKDIRLLNKKIELLSYSSIQKKIAYALLYKTDVNDKNFLDLDYSKKSWAEHLNVSRPSLHRELKKLSAKDIIEIKDKKIIVLQRNELKNILNKF